MSWNVIAAVEQEDHDNVVRPMILTRASAGITHSAYVAMGDIIDFDGMDAEVIAVQHMFQPLGSDISPNSVAHVKFHRALADFEIDRLVKLGFKDC